MEKPMREKLGDIYTEQTTSLIGKDAVALAKELAGC